METNLMNYYRSLENIVKKWDLNKFLEKHEEFKFGYYKNIS